MCGSASAAQSRPVEEARNEVGQNNQQVALAQAVPALPIVLQAGQMLSLRSRGEVRNYKFVRKINEGTYGYVARVETEDKTFAIKIVKNVEHYSNSYFSEIQVMDRIGRNRGLIHSSFFGELDGPLPRNFTRYAIVMPLLGPSMGNVLARMKAQNTVFKRRDIQILGKQLAAALRTLDEYGVAHLDVKPDNIMFSRQVNTFKKTLEPQEHRGEGPIYYAHLESLEIKLGDFGISLFTDTNPVIRGVFQTHPYRAPEVFMDLPFGPKVDVWSLGCILYQLYENTVLFDFRPFEMLEQFRAMRDVTQQGPSKRMMLLARDSRSPVVTVRDDDATINEPIVRVRTSALHLRQRSPADAEFFELLRACLTFDMDIRPNITGVSASRVFII